MSDIDVSNKGVNKNLNVLDPYTANGPNKVHQRILKELAAEVGQVFAHLFQQSPDTNENPKRIVFHNIGPLIRKGDMALANS